MPVGRGAGRSDVKEITESVDREQGREEQGMRDVEMSSCCPLALLYFTFLTRLQRVVKTEQKWRG